MREPTRDSIELRRQEVDGKEVFVYERHRSAELKRKLQWWGIAVAGVAVGTLVFLFLASVVYFLLPVIAVLVIFSALRALLAPGIPRSGR